MALFDLVGYRRRWQFLRCVEKTKVMDFAPIVIGGCGNSGTTLLRATLNAHAEIASGPESTVFLQRVSSPRTIADRFNIPADVVERLLRDSRSQADFVERFARYCLQQRRKTIWADKTPENVGRLDFIFRHFPRAKFVHVVRDGRDVACSLRTQPWMKLPASSRQTATGLLHCARYWAERIDAAMRYRDDPRYIEIRYEDFIRRPEPTLRRLLAFLDVPWDDRLLDRDYVNASMVSEEGSPPSSASGPLFVGSIGRWRSELTSDAVALITPHVTPTLVKLGYIDDHGAETPAGWSTEAAVGFGE